MTDRFCVLGEVDEHVAKLHELADAGVDQFNVYLMNGDEESSSRHRPRGHPGDDDERGRERRGPVASGSATGRPAR